MWEKILRWFLASAAAVAITSQPASTNAHQDPASQPASQTHLEYVIDNTLRVVVDRTLSYRRRGMLYSFEIHTKNDSQKRFSQPPSLTETGILFKPLEYYTDDTLEGLTLEYSTNKSASWRAVPDDVQQFPLLMYTYEQYKKWIELVDTTEGYVDKMSDFFAWIDRNKLEITPAHAPLGKSFAVYVPVENIMSWINATALFGEYVTSVRVQMPFTMNPSVMSPFPEQPYFFVKSAVGYHSYEGLTGRTHYALEVTDPCKPIVQKQERGRIFGTPEPVYVRITGC